MDEAKKNYKQAVKINKKVYSLQDGNCKIFNDEQ